MNYETAISMKVIKTKQYILLLILIMLFRDGTMYCSKKADEFVTY